MIYERDRKICREIGLLIEGLDGIVMPDKPIKRIELVQSKPELLKTYFRYVSAGDKYNERYVIFAEGLEKYLANIFKEMGIEDSFENCSTIIMSIVCHEVRHRLQRHNRVNLFNSSYFPPIVSEQIKAIENFCKKKGFKENLDLEFDAKVIEVLVMKKRICSPLTAEKLQLMAEIILAQ